MIRLDDRGFFELHLPDKDSAFNYSLHSFYEKMNENGKIRTHFFQVYPMSHLSHLMKVGIVVHLEN